MADHCCEECHVNTQEIRTVHRVLCAGCYAQLKDNARREEAIYRGERPAGYVPLAFVD